MTGQSSRGGPQREGLSARRRALHGTLIVATFVLAAGISALAAPGGQRPPGAGVGRTFQITGSVDGLYPGADTTLMLRVNNPQQFTIVLTSLEVTASDASDQCPASTLAFGALTEQITIPAREDAVVPVPVAMLAASPDACQGATFPLLYTGEATRS